MTKNNLNIIIEEQNVDFSFKKNKSQLNIRFNRIAFIFFIFFLISLIFSIHLIHLGSRKPGEKIDKNFGKINLKDYINDFIEKNN